MQLIVVDDKEPRLVVIEPSYWDKTKGFFEQAKGSIEDLGKNIGMVEHRTKKIYYDFLDKIDQIGAVFPDLVTPLQRWMSPTD
jgi:hypothetical protein